MKNLADSGAAGEVYYVAPIFHKMNQFNDAYLSGKIIEKSTKMLVRCLPTLKSDKACCITFRSGNDFIWQEPNPGSRPLEGDFSAEHQLNYIREFFTEISMSIDLNYFQELYNSLVRAIREENIRIDNVDQRMGLSEHELMNRIRLFLRTYFSLEMILLFQDSETDQTD